MIPAANPLSCLCSAFIADAHPLFSVAGANSSKDLTVSVPADIGGGEDELDEALDSLPPTPVEAPAAAPASRDLKLELSFTHELLELHPALQAQDGRVRAFTNLAPEEGLVPLLVQLRAALLQAAPELAAALPALVLSSFEDESEEYVAVEYFAQLLEDGEVMVGIAPEPAPEAEPDSQPKPDPEAVESWTERQRRLHMSPSEEASKALALTEQEHERPVSRGHAVSEERKAEMQRVFSQIDTDGDDQVRFLLLGP